MEKIKLARRYDGRGECAEFYQPEAQMDWQLWEYEGVQVCYVSGSCTEGYDSDCAMTLEIPMEAAPFMAIHNHTNHWCRPVFGSSWEALPEKLVSGLLVQRGGSWQYFLPVCADAFKTAIRGTSEGFAFYLYPNCSGVTQCREQLIFVTAEGSEPLDLMRSCARAAARLLGLPLRQERAMPEVFEWLGWCSWDALQIRVNHKGLLEKAEEFRRKQVPVHFGIIDDMWADVPALNEIPEDASFRDMVKAMHASKLRAFRGDPNRFPRGIEQAVVDLKAAGIPKVGIWFPVTGYWSGFEPEGEAVALADYLAYAPNGRLLVDPPKAKELYDLLCARIRSWGADFVKIDNQGMHTQLRGTAPIGQTAGQMQAALDAATAAHFDGALINCMGMPSECMFHRPTSAVCRCSDDFLPENREWFAKHILQCAYNGLLQGQYYVNDWDMWWTDDSQAAKNSLCRAISGGPIYISDKLERTRPEVLVPLVFGDGRILRCDESATPTADCLLEDPTQKNTVFKLRNRAGKVGILAAFHISAENKPVSGIVSAEDAGISGACICYEHFTGACFRLEAGEGFSLTLDGSDDFRLYTFAPAEEITLLGRLDKYIGVKAITSWDGKLVQLYEGGVFGFVCNREVRVFSGDRELPVQRKGLLCTVEAKPEETLLRFI